MKYNKLILFLVVCSFVLLLSCDAAVTGLYCKPDIYDFGTVNLGENTGYIVRIYNDSEDTVIIRGFQFYGYHLSDFYISDGGIINTRIYPGGIHKVTVRFKPTGEGLRRVRLIIRSNAPVTTTSIEFSGIGKRAPILSVSETDYNFGGVFYQSKANHTFTITNTGTAQLDVTGFNVIGVQSQYFSVVSTNTPMYIQPLETDTFIVEAAPTMIGNFNAILEINHNGVNQNPYRINLYVTGDNSAQEFSLATNLPIDMEYSTIYGSSTKKFKIENTGTEILTVSDVKLSTGTEFKFIEIQNKNGSHISLPTKIDPNEYIWSVFEFNASAPGNYQDKVIFTHDAYNVPNPYECDIVGTFKNVKVFSNAGTFNWTVPNGVNSIKVLVVGAGGGGSGSYYGGGGSGWVVAKDINVTPGDSIQITVGKGGTGGVPNTNTSPGGDGGDSSFGTTVSAQGGKGGGGAGAGYYGGGDGGSGGGGAGNSGYGGDGGSNGSDGDNGATYPGGLGGHFDSVANFASNLSAGVGGKAGTSSHCGGGGAGGVLIDGNGPSASDGGDTWSGKGGEGHGSGGGAGGYNGSRPGGGEGADGLVFIEY